MHPAPQVAPSAMQLPSQQQQRPDRPVNDIGEPSNVLHCRNVTSEVTQSGLVNLFESYGRVINVVMLRARNQALIELDSIDSARRCVDDLCHRGSGHAEVDGRRVWVKYSRHGALSETPPGKTLLVSMFNPAYDIQAAVPITPYIVYQIFGNYGAVEKVVVLPRNASSAANHHRVQALVQYDSQESAERVKGMLQGQPVNLADYASFHLDIQYSKVTEISCQGNAQQSLVIPKGLTPQLLQQQQQQEQQQQQQQQQQQMMMMMAGVGMPTFPPGAMPPWPMPLAQCPGQPPAPWAPPPREQQQQPPAEQRQLWETGPPGAAAPQGGPCGFQPHPSYAPAS